MISSSYLILGFDNLLFSIWKDKTINKSDILESAFRLKVEKQDLK